ncbi:MAG: PAS domain-containing sensor histidine kinase [Myxococcota bacterium]
MSMKNAASVDGHYLRDELYALIRTDSLIFDFLQTGSLDGIWYWDLIAPEHEWMSPRMWEVLGYDPADKPHSPSAWQDIIHPDDLNVALANFNAHCADPGHPYDQMVRYRHRDGSTVWIRCRGIAIRSADGTPLRMLGAHTDVTPLKTIEAALEETNALLEDRNAELEQMAYITSHDLKTPIRQVRDLASLLAEEVAALNRPDLMHIIAMIEGKANQAVQMHEDMLEYTQAGARNVSLEPINLDETIKALWSLIGASSGFTLQLDAPTEPMALPRMLIQTVLNNLMSNAINHHDRENGVVTVHARRTGGHLQLMVADDGPGIPAAHRARIFRLFETIRPKAQSGGTGLGLAIVKKIVTRAGATVTLQDNAPRGSRFIIDWPLSSAPARTPA